MHKIVNLTKTYSKKKKRIKKRSSKNPEHNILFINSL